MKHFKSISLALIVVSLTVLENVALAQSTDQTNPTAVTSPELIINGPKKNNEQHYYSFTAGPGEVTISLSVKAKTSSTFVGIKIFDLAMNTLGYHNMSADTSSPAMALKKFDVGEKQTLVMSFTSDSSLGECRLKFSGAVEFPESTANGSSPATLSKSNPIMSSSQPEEMTAASDQGSPPGESNGGSKKSFVFSILDAAGQRFNIPAAGRLCLEMKDGSVQEFDLAQVKKIFVKQ